MYYFKHALNMRMMKYIFGYIIFNNDEWIISMTLKRHIPRQKWIWISCHLMLRVREVVLTAGIRET